MDASKLLEEIVQKEWMLHCVAPQKMNILYAFSLIIDNSSYYVHQCICSYIIRINRHIGFLPEEFSCVVNILMKQLSSPSPTLRLNAANALTELGVESADVHQVLQDSEQAAIDEVKEEDTIEIQNDFSADKEVSSLGIDEQASTSNSEPLDPDYHPPEEQFDPDYHPPGEQSSDENSSDEEEPEDTELEDYLMRGKKQHTTAGTKTKSDMFPHRGRGRPSKHLSKKGPRLTSEFSFTKSDASSTASKPPEIEIHQDSENIENQEVESVTIPEPIPQPVAQLHVHVVKSEEDTSNSFDQSVDSDQNSESFRPNVDISDDHDDCVVVDVIEPRRKKSRLKNDNQTVTTQNSAESRAPFAADFDLKIKEENTTNSTSNSLNSCQKESTSKSFQLEFEYRTTGTSHSWGDNNQTVVDKQIPNTTQVTDDVSMDTRSNGEHGAFIFGQSKKAHDVISVDVDSPPSSNKDDNNSKREGPVVSPVGHLSDSENESSGSWHVSVNSKTPPDIEVSQNDDVTSDKNSSYDGCSTGSSTESSSESSDDGMNSFEIKSVGFRPIKKTQLAKTKQKKKRSKRENKHHSQVLEDRVNIEYEKSAVVKDLKICLNRNTCESYLSVHDSEHI